MDGQRTTEEEMHVAIDRKIKGECEERDEDEWGRTVKAEWAGGEEGDLGKDKASKGVG